MSEVSRLFASATHKCLPFLCLVLSILPSVENLDYQNDKLAPIILVPGVSNTRLEGKWTTSGHPAYCDGKEKDWEHLWLNFAMAALGPGYLKCWAYRLKLLYDRAARKCTNEPGVEVRVVGKLGSLQSCEYLTDNIVTQQTSMSKYFHDMIEALKKAGYSSDSSLKAHGYDWRYAPPRQDDVNYYTGFTELVEKVASDTKRKVAIVAHSMGGLVAAHFLLNKPQEWKDKYIQIFLTVGTPWLGSNKAISNYIVGNTYGIPTMSKPIMKALVRSFQSIAYLLPQEEAFKDTVLVEWVPKNKKYTPKEYQEFFRDVHFETGYLMREDCRPLFPIPLDKLGVKMNCVWTNLTKLETPGTYRVKAERISRAKDFEIVNTEGDGTVPLLSLRYCEKFQGPNLTVQNFQGFEHTGIIFEKIFHDHVLSAVKDAQPFS